MSGADVPEWARDMLKDHESRIRAVERAVWWVFGVGSGVGALVMMVVNGVLKKLT